MISSQNYSSINCDSSFSTIPKPDCLMWKYERNGIYSVRSGYNSVMRNES